MASAYLHTPFSKTPNAMTPEKQSSPTRKFQFMTNDDARPPISSADLPWVKESAKRVFDEMENTKVKLMEKMQGIDHQIYLQKLPFLQYYDPDTDKIKSQHEITNVIQKSFDFFQADPSLFKGSQYRPEKFYFAKPKPKSKANLSLSSKKETMTKEFTTPVREAKTHREVQYSSEKKLPYLKAFYANQGEGSLKDDDLHRLSDEVSTQVETAPSLKLMSSGPATQRDDKINNGLRLYEKEKIPSGLYKGTVKRRVILEEIQKSYNKAQGADNVRESKSIIKNLSTLVREKADEIVDTPRKAKPINLTTRSPVNNAFYQVLVMPTNQKTAVSKRLNALSEIVEKRGLSWYRE